MYDLMIKNGTIVDGTRHKPYQANICVKDGIIAAIGGGFSDSDAVRVIDAAGKIISPGFIDIHSHSDSAPFAGHLCDSKIQQGITTEITGNCGSSAVPNAPEALVRENVFASVSGYLSAINAKGHINNTGALIGHGQLRLAVMGFVNRAPSEEEMQKLETLLDHELSCGAFGMSLGLIYPPSAFSEREELLRLAKVVARHDAVLSVHMRNEGPRIFEAVDEMLSIAADSGVHLEISHLKLMGEPQWGRADELTRKIEAARSEGVNVNCDQYPYCATSTSLSAVLPHWAHDGGHDKIMERLNAPTEELKAEIRAKVEERGGVDTILITSARNCPQYAARYLGDICRELNLEPADAVIRVLLDASAVVSCIFFCISQQDMLKIMPKLYISVGTDGYAMSLDPNITKTVPHPRNYGTFPQYFSLVRDHKLLSVEEAVYKCTALPASVMGIRDRGILKPGYRADITVFDWDKIGSSGTFIESRVKPQGMEYVIINGKAALEHGEVVDAHTGWALNRQQ